MERELFLRERGRASKLGRFSVGNHDKVSLSFLHECSQEGKVPPLINSSGKGYFIRFHLSSFSCRDRQKRLGDMQCARVEGGM